MARPLKGRVIYDERRKKPVYALRFRANGRRQYVTLGGKQDGWTQELAEQALRHVIADVERGTWQPPNPEPEPEVRIDRDPTLHQFASDWYEANKGAWRPNTQLDYEWQLTHHLLPFFRRHHLSQITVAEVDRYRSAKVREGALSATSINKTITRLAQILDVAVEYDLIERNPAKGKRRRVKASKPAPVWLDRAEHIAALLEAASELDREARRDRRHVGRRAMLATLTLAGLRIGELCELRWRDVDLSGGKITVRASKTDAGIRQVDMLPLLRDELAVLKASAKRVEPTARVFGTSSGGRPEPQQHSQSDPGACRRACQRQACGGFRGPATRALDSAQAPPHIRQRARSARR